MSVTVTAINNSHTFLIYVQDTFADMIEDAGFKRVSYESIMGGIVAMHSGFKL